jgi:hypothetical protein
MRINITCSSVYERKYNGFSSELIALLDFGILFFQISSFPSASSYASLNASLRRKLNILAKGNINRWDIASSSLSTQRTESNISVKLSINIQILTFIPKEFSLIFLFLFRPVCAPTACWFKRGFMNAS